MEVTPEDSRPPTRALYRAPRAEPGGPGVFSAQKTRDSLVTPFLRPKASSQPSASLLPGSQAPTMGANPALASPRIVVT